MKAKESQNQIQFDNYIKKPARLGAYTTHIYNNDPKHLLFLLSRYKFVAKMLEGKKNVLEIGVGDAFGLPLVAQTVERIHAVDWEPLLMDDNKERLSDLNCSFECIDITEKSVYGTYGAAYSLDVIEHIPPEKNDLFLYNIVSSLSKNGILILGTPNITSKKYASEGSREGHINLKSHKALKKDLEKYFYNVFMFSMNDEVVHTGYYNMSQYIIGMGVGKKS